ncbi:N-acetylmuramoyl-L-alanine amidase CwlD [Texcoconibacillus texcoconensis]|uniref:N-acetylmuramoyl-L-alanine amidase n=1 Tax=Texcoconibacillus texcoconensis TaxID=1095777 RepID=A0A840QUI3_9BACI|nr:N-acetylmuramoyl-L-alanine amidase CwlD [Texcoconibacillus texcoconensis]MBB5174949.1 N-acetylmuramoyl-L-alanine amidase [Texcoconibacillus texcoconensis]
MNRWIKRMLFILGFIALVYVVQYPLTTQDSGSMQMPLSGQVIVVDPGHGGIDGGATSKSGTLEKDVALDIAFKLRDYLQESGALVLMTREGDYDLADKETQRVRTRKLEDLRERLKLVNESNADMFISLHLNAIPSPKWSGAQTFYNRAIEGSDTLAKHIQGELRRNLENTNRLAKPVNNVYLMQESKIPGALVEVGFLSNPSEADRLNTKEYQQKLAASIYEGMLRYGAGDPLPSE